MRNANAQNITNAVVASAATAGDPRLRAIFASLIRHLHDFVREVELTPAEWEAGIAFLTQTGQKCDAKRQEFMLLSDTFGVTMLVDALANRKAGSATESTVLGPFFTLDAPDVPIGGTIAAKGIGFPLFVRGQISDSAGIPVSGAVIEAWETDGDGLYDTQYADRELPDCRGRIRSAADGTYAFRAVLPVEYSIPTDGPVGALMMRLGRHTMRPAHLHFQISADGHVPVTTAIYVEGDSYLDSDAVFGVKSSLVEPFVRHDSPSEAQALGVSAPFYTLARDFVLEPALVPARV
jgi:protocatechuate 3,4-dioxygenase beta subunit